jgi:translation initiation factor IF-2
MLKYRVYEVARDLNVKSKEISDFIEKYFKETKKHMAFLTEEELNFIFDYYTQKNSVKDLTEYFSTRKKTSPKVDLKVSQRSGVNEETTHNKKNSLKEKVVTNKKPLFISRNDLKASLQKFNFLPKKPNVKINNSNSAAKTPLYSRRVIDTRSSHVDIERYNEKYDRLASEKVKVDNIIKKQKITQRYQQRFRYRSSKRETESERLKRIALERKAKPITISIPEKIIVSELAFRLKATVSEVIKKLIDMGVMAAANDEIDFDIASLVAMEFHAKVEREVFVTIEEKIIDTSKDSSEDLKLRAPIVVVMGHVDHGKTSLLDAIRNENVATSESGGITQHIGAYCVKSSTGDITFIDTPGHEAFTTMRNMGAKVTDIAILVVAADDGVMPQTVEAISHAKEAKVPIIVAINKIDKEGADPERIKQQITEHGLVPEEWGGDIPCVEISAKTKKNLSSLLDVISLIAELKELKANPNRSAKGTIIEAKIDKGRGPIATVLVQNGTLYVGNLVVAGSCIARIRTMFDCKGKHLKKAGPSVPVEIAGFTGIPSGGDVLNVVSDERLAKELVQQRKSKEKEKRFGSQTKVTLDNLFNQIELSDVKELKVIIKADVQGSAEALKQSFLALSNDEIHVNVIHYAAGDINESDIMLANASNAVVIGFNVKADNLAEKTAKFYNIKIRFYDVIYDSVDYIRNIVKKMKKIEFKEVISGHAECRHIYNITGVGTILGSYVIDGIIKRNSSVRVLRGDSVIAECKISSLKRFKDDVKEVAKGYECGLRLENFNSAKKGDIFEAFSLEEQ